MVLNHKNNIKIGGIMKSEENVESSTLSNRAVEELKEQAKKSGFDLLHDLMLNDYVRTDDGAYLRRDTGHVGYDSFVGKPNLSKTVVDRMKKEIEELTPETRKEVLTAIAMKFPDVASKIKDIYMQYKDE